MSFDFDRKSINDILARIDELAERDRQLIQERVPPDTIGMTEVSDEEFATFFEQQLAADLHLVTPLPDGSEQKQPGVPTITFPDGRVLMGSPLAIMLELADGGPELRKRYERIRGIA